MTRTGRRAYFVAGVTLAGMLVLSGASGGGIKCGAGGPKPASPGFHPKSVLPGTEGQTRHNVWIGHAPPHREGGHWVEIGTKQAPGLGQGWPVWIWVGA